MSPTRKAQIDFSIVALFDALDAQRRDRALSWQGVAQELWNQSAALNAQRNDHPISAATLTGMAKRGDTSCQHVLFMLRWLGRDRESFTSGARADGSMAGTAMADGKKPGRKKTAARKRAALPLAGPDQRLCWDLQKLYDSLDAQLARELRCAEPAQRNRAGAVRDLYELAMRIVHWLDCAARDFVYAASW